MQRDATTQRMVPDPTKFPDGLDTLASQIHALGLKIGIYRFVYHTVTSTLVKLTIDFVATRVPTLVLGSLALLGTKKLMPPLLASGGLIVSPSVKHSPAQHQLTHYI